MHSPRYANTFYFWRKKLSCRHRSQKSKGINLTLFFGVRESSLTNLGGNHSVLQSEDVEVGISAFIFQTTTLHLDVCFLLLFFFSGSFHSAHYFLVSDYSYHCVRIKLTKNTSIGKREHFYSTENILMQTSVLFEIIITHEEK